MKVVDTTGAGDTFCGVLAASLAQGAPLATALRRANAAAALACTRPGAQAAQPGRAEIDALLARHATVRSEAAHPTGSTGSTGSTGRA